MRDIVYGFEATADSGVRAFYYESAMKLVTDSGDLRIDWTSAPAKASRTLCPPGAYINGLSSSDAPFIGDSWPNGNLICTTPSYYSS